MLYIGEQVGQRHARPARGRHRGRPARGHEPRGHGQANAITVLAASERGGLLHAPDTYMEKLVRRAASRPATVDITLTPAREPRAHRRRAAAARSATSPSSSSIGRATTRSSSEVRATGARIKLISDGDLSAAISCAVSGTGVHAVMGIGGAPEGVITAAALRCLGGEIQARFRFRNDEERARAARMGHTDEERVYHTDDLAPGENLVFAPTGVTEGDLLHGVRFFGGGARTHSLVMAYQTKQVRFVDTVHMFDRDKPPAVRL